MTQTNDEQILALKKKIEEKEKLLKETERFQPITNCSIDLDGVRSNIQVLDKFTLTALLLKLNVYKLSAEDLELDLNDVYFSGFRILDWISDVKSKLANLNRKEEKEKLAKLKSRLTSLLSKEKSVELEISDIASMLD